MMALLTLSGVVLTLMAVAAGVSGLGSSWTFSSDLSPDQLAEVLSLTSSPKLSLLHH